MASRIQGITVEIGGDTTGLQNALKGVNSSIKTTQASLKDVNKLLKLDPTHTELNDRSKTIDPSPKISIAGSHIDLGNDCIIQHGGLLPEGESETPQMPDP